MGTLLKQYQDLETKVISQLREIISNSKTYSKNVDTKAIKVDLDEYKEIIILNDKLTLLDGDGYATYLNYTIISLKELIFIVENHLVVSK